MEHEKKPVQKKTEPKEPKVVKFVCKNMSRRALESAEFALEPFSHAGFSSGSAHVDREVAKMFADIRELRAQL